MGESGSRISLLNPIDKDPEDRQSEYSFATYVGGVVGQKSGQKKLLSVRIKGSKNSSLIYFVMLVNNTRETVKREGKAH